MSRKKLLGLVPLLAIAAFAVTPVAAQAVTPRLFVNGVEVGTGTEPNPQPVISWGILTLKNAELGLVKCENVFGGQMSNPTLTTSPGEAIVQGFSVYNCKSEACELLGGHIEIGPLGEGENVLGTKITVEHITTPWKAVVLEPAAGVYELKVGNKQVSGEPEFENKIRFRVTCHAKAVTVEFHGELHPKALNLGTSAGNPSEIKFKGLSSGELESSPAGGGTVEGPLKLFDAEGEGVVLVKSI